MKKLLAIALTAALGLSACSGQASKSESVALNIGATAVPHAEILNFIKDDMAAEGVEFTVTEFGDYTLLNSALNDGQIDANFFQHVPYLENYVADSGNDLTWVAKVHTEPMGVYSSKLQDINDLPDGAKVGIPNDATNEARALLLFEANGLIKLREGAGFSALPSDIIENPKNLSFIELDAAVLPRALDETDVSAINTNYALEAGLDPNSDALIIEAKDSPYANIIAVKSADKDSEAITKLVKVLTSDKVRDFINTKYEGAIVVSF